MGTYLNRTFKSSTFPHYGDCVQHDSALARMLFSILYEAVFVQVDTMLTDREAEETKKAVRDGLNMVMEKSVQFHPPFIGSLQVQHYMMRADSEFSVWGV